MDYKEYQDFCKTTESLPEKVTVDNERFDAVTALFINASELLDMLKKNIFYERPIDEAKWLDQLKSANRNIADLISRQNVRINHPTNRDTELDVDVRIAHSIIGMCTETGELLEALTKSLDPDVDFDVVNFGEELGDMHWYAAIGSDAANQDFETILQTNRTKLEKRYNEGKFTETNANVRDLEAERTILEDGLEDVGSVVEEKVVTEQEVTLPKRTRSKRAK
jgi:NTP pyrophosphatase (non-canonical NTP hydrolase)